MLSHPLRLFLIISFLLSFLFSPVSARPWYNELAVDVPLEGGGMVMYSRMVRVKKYMDVGLVVGGGLLEREFELDSSGFLDLDAETSSTVLPFIGPRISFHSHIAGVSLAWGAFYSKTDFDVTGGGNTWSGTKKAWGTGFYSPLLVLDFYNEKYDLVFGFGLSGFFGTSFPNLVAKNGTSEVRTSANPVNSLSFIVRTRWSDRRRDRSRDYFDDDEF